MAGEQRAPLRLSDGNAIDLGFATDFHILLRAIERTMPEDAVLYLEGGATSPAVAAFLRARSATGPRDLGPSGRGEVACFHLPLKEGNLHGLRLIAEDCVSREVARHLAVYRDDEVLLWAEDAGDGAVLVAASLPDERIERFQLALGASLRRPKRYGWFGLRRSS
jgi:hypothetical protein